MGGLPQRGRAMDARGGQSGRSIARASANKALVVLASNLNQSVSRLRDAESIDVVHLGTVLGTVVCWVGDYLMGIRQKGWAVARVTVREGGV